MLPGMDFDAEARITPELERRLESLNAFAAFRTGQGNSGDQAAAPEFDEIMGVALQDVRREASRYDHQELDLDPALLHIPCPTAPPLKGRDQSSGPGRKHCGGDHEFGVED